MSIVFSGCSLNPLRCGGTSTIVVVIARPCTCFTRSCTVCFTVCFSCCRPTVCTAYIVTPATAAAAAVSICRCTVAGIFAIVVCCTIALGGGSLFSGYFFGSTPRTAALAAGRVHRAHPAVLKLAVVCVAAAFAVSAVGAAMLERAVSAHPAACETFLC